MMAIRELQEDEEILSIRELAPDEKIIPIETKRQSISREILSKANPFKLIDAAAEILNYPFRKGGELLGRGVEAGAERVLPESKGLVIAGPRSSVLPFLPIFNPAKEGATETTPTAPLTPAPKILGGAANIGFQLGAPGPITKFALKPFGRITRPPQVAKTQALAEEFEIPISAGQATQSPVLSQLESLPPRFPIGSKPIVEFGRKQTEAAERAVTKIGESVAKESVDTIAAGETFNEGYQLASQAARTKANEAYDLIKTVMPAEASFETPSLLKAAQQVGKETQLSKGIIVSRGEQLAGKIEKGLTPSEKIPQFEYDSTVDVLIKKYAMDNPAREMTFEGMDLLRKDLRAALRASRNDQDTKRIGTLIDGLTADIAATANRYPQAAKLLDEADKIYRNEVAPYFTRGKLTRQLSEKDASQIVKTAIWGNRDHPENIELIKSALNNKASYNTLVRGWWDDLISKSVDPKTDVFSIQRFLTNYEKFTPETRVALLGENAKKSDKLAELLDQIDRARIAGANPSETARGILGAGQIFGGIRIATVDLPAGNIGAVIKGGALFLTPLGLGKVLASPKGIDLLINGFQLNPRTPGAIATFARIAALANMSGSSGSAVGDKEGQ